MPAAVPFIVGALIAGAKIAVVGAIVGGLSYAISSPLPANPRSRVAAEAAVFPIDSWGEHTP